MSSLWNTRYYWGLTALVLAAYLPAYGAGFVWDDDYYVVANATLQSLAGLKSIWLDIYSTPQYYPLVHTSLWLEYRLVGASPGLYHVSNVVLHAANALLLWRLLARLDVPGPWLAAAIFALHPLQVETVAWITERKNLLSALFYLSAAITYLRFSREADEGRRRWGIYAACFALYAAALLSKSVAATLPAALLLVLWYRRGAILGRDWGTLLPMLLLGIASGLLTVWLEREHVLAKGPEWDLSFLDRCLVAGHALWFYAAKLVWPENLAFIYPRWRIDAGVWWQYLFPLSAIAVMATLFALRRRAGRGPVTAVLYYAGTLFPALGFFNFYPMRYSFVANHFQYLACVGLIALGVAGLLRAADAMRASQAARSALAASLLAILASLSFWNARAFADPESLWRDTLAKNPEAWMAHHNLGMELDRQGRYREAKMHYQAAVDLLPTHARAHHKLGRSLAREGRLAEAIEEFKTAIRLSPDEKQFHSSLGDAYLRQSDFAAAEAEFRRVLTPPFDHAPTEVKLARALLGQGRSVEAREALNKALQIDPQNPQATVLLMEIK